MSIVKKEDIRITKTDRAIMKSLTALLEKRKFAYLTVMDICMQASISRATFYAHFDDKYDLLRQWFINLKTELIPHGCTYEQIEAKINKYTANNRTIIKNVAANINEETLNLIYQVILSEFIGFQKKKNSDINHVISSGFCAGGVISYIGWQVKNDFPANIPAMNPTLYNLITKIVK